MDETRSRTALSTAQAGCLLAAPLVALIARGLMVPYWDEPAKYIDQLSDDPTRSDVGAWLVIVSALLLIPAVLGLAGLVVDQMPRLALVGSALAVIGCIGMACLSTMTLMAGQMVRLGNRDAAVAIWRRAWNESMFWPMPAEIVHLGSLGIIVLAVGLYRTRVVPRATAVLVGLGGATMMTTSAGPIRGILIATALLALIGFAWVVLAIRDESDPARAAGPTTQPGVS